MTVRVADVQPSTTRVLLALVRVHERTGRATVLSVAREAQRGTAVTHKHLSILRELGLAEWEPYSHGTLRPLVYSVAA